MNKSIKTCVIVLERLFFPPLFKFMLGVVTLAVLLLVVCPGAFADNCQIQINPINFGNLNPFDNAAVDISTTITATACKNYAGDEILLPGVSNGSAILQGQTNKTTATATYYLYTDSGHQQPWTESNGPVIPKNCSSDTCTIKVYAVLPADLWTLNNHATHEEGSYTSTLNPVIEESSIATALNAQLSIANACNFTDVNNADLGSYQPSGANKYTDLDQSTSFAIACTVGGAQPYISLSPAHGSSGGSSDLVNGSSPYKLAYQLWQPSGPAPDAPCTYSGTQWGDIGSYRFALGTPVGIYKYFQYNVCIQVLAGQQVPAGNYSDTIALSYDF